MNSAERPSTTAHSRPRRAAIITANLRKNGETGFSPLASCKRSRQAETSARIGDGFRTCSDCWRSLQRLYARCFTFAPRWALPLADGLGSSNSAQHVERDHLGQPRRGQLGPADVPARVDPLVHHLARRAEQVGQQGVHVLFELPEVPGPLGRLGQADVLFALPPHGVEQQHAARRDHPPLARGKRPQGRATSTRR